MPDNLKPTIFQRRFRHMLSLTTFLSVFFFSSFASADTIKIGLRAHHGIEKSMQQWKQTADYLSEKIPEHKFDNICNININQLKILLMKTKQVLAVMITSLFLLYGCSNNEASVEESTLASKASESHGSSEIHRVYPKEQAEVLATFGAIAQSIKDGAGLGAESEYMDQLISFHAYGDKFVEFNGGMSFDSAGNEENERTLFGVYLKEWDYEVNQFAAVPGTLKVAVYYGNVANVTFISDFIVGGNQVDLLITLLFVKTDGEWKLVHEHHSPENLQQI